jgi:hypothetical protein
MINLLKAMANMRAPGCTVNRLTRPYFTGAGLSRRDLPLGAPVVKHVLALPDSRAVLSTSAMSRLPIPSP